MGNIGGNDWAAIIVATLATMVVLVLSLVAIVQIRRAEHLCSTVRTNWLLAVLLAPLFGATAWFAVGDRLRQD
jgi:hypothetical protein